jgi:hypothetical protein
MNPVWSLVPTTTAAGDGTCKSIFSEIFTGHGQLLPSSQGVSSTGATGAFPQQDWDSAGDSFAGAFST